MRKIGFFGFFTVIYMRGGGGGFGFLGLIIILTSPRNVIPVFSPRRLCILVNIYHHSKEKTSVFWRGGNFFVATQLDNSGGD
jgi:hypothetical protein